MIVSLEKAILHILDANTGVASYSDTELDLSNPVESSYICNHIEKIYDDPLLRSGEFNNNSGFLYHLKQYKSKDLNFPAFSKFVSEKLYELIKESDNIHSCDIIVCEFQANESPTIGILKCDNKIGQVHRVVQQENAVKNEIVNHTAILPPQNQRISECAFIDLTELTIRYKSKKLMVQGEKIDLFAEGLLECVFDISVKESFNALERIAQKVSLEYGGDGIDEASKIKDYVKSTAIVNEQVEVSEFAEKVFDTLPTARAEFIEKTQKAMVPERFKMNEYITKKINKNMRLITDTGIEISFPAEYYKDGENITISESEDGKISIQINNVSEILNK